MTVLSEISLSLRRGEAAAIMGPSGSGKSTLLYIAGALDPPTLGEVRLDGIDPYGLPERDAAALRNEKIGFVFQDHCLLPQCTVLENVLVPTLVSKHQAGHRKRAEDLWKTPGLAAELGSKGAQKVREHYSVACMAGRAAEVYQAIAAEPMRR